MPAIGDTLREARMRQRLDIADVESQTKIRAKYLRALENEEFSMLPGPTFVKTFLRTYAERLGLDPHTLVEQYRAEHEPRDELEARGPLPVPPARDRRRGWIPGPWVIATLLILAVLGGLVALGLSADDDGNDGGGGAPAGAERTTTERQGRPRRKRPATPSVVVLRITPAPATPTYACVDRGAGTQVVFEGTLEAPQTFRGPRLRVNLGKTSVQLTANGRQVPIEPGPEAVGFEFTPGSTRRLPIGERPCA
jgi:hypothetical protein